ncbi:MAG TPA: MarR family transcriptional regulator [Bacteriovoracaceae bacterium]|nr:MarR family transcriptional regulator [Bacteriovoracaceae bacterium]
MLAKRLLVSIPTTIRIIRRLSVAKVGKKLSLQQLRVLVLIKENKGQAELAELLYISPAAVSKMVDSLVTKKLVTKKPGKDARSKSLQLTKDGKRTLATVSAYVEDQLTAGLERLTAKEHAELNRGLEVLDKFMGIVNEH